MDIKTIEELPPLFCFILDQLLPITAESRERSKWKAQYQMDIKTIEELPPLFCFILDQLLPITAESRERSKWKAQYQIC